MVLIDATAMQSEHRTRGVGAYVRELVRHLERRGDAEPVYLASTVGYDLVRDALPPERTIRVFRPHAPAHTYWTYNEIALRVALWRAKPRVFLAPDFNGVVPNPFGVTVAVLHDATALKLAPRAPRGPSDALDALRWRAYFAKLRRADHVIARSHAVKRDAVERLGLRPERVSVVAQGLDRERFRPSAGAGEYAGAAPYVLHVGGSNENKNLAASIAAFARVAERHPNLTLNLVGPWRDRDVTWLEQFTTRLGVRGRVRHLGFVPDDALPSLYGNATALLFASLEEGYGLPVLESMACGGPVLTSDRSALPEVAGSAALLVDPTSVDAIAAGLERIVTSPGLRDELRRRGFERARRFSWAALADEVWSVVQGAAEPAARRAKREVDVR